MPSSWAPHFSVQLAAPDRPNAVHTNGDRIGGHVSILGDPARTIPLNRITIHFKGKIKTQVTTGTGENRSTHYGKAILFHFSQQCPQTVYPINCPQSWPFEFVFPWESQPTPQPKTFIPSDYFAHQAGHPLPPTMGYRRKDIEVSYYVEITANDPTAIIFTTVKNRLPITFAPSRSILTPSLSLHTQTRLLGRVSKKLDPELANQHYSFKEKMHRFWTTADPKPTASFSISSSVPSQLTVGGPLPITLSLQHNKALTTAPQVPAVHLVNIHARLNAWTYVRVPSRSFFGTHSDYTASFKEKIPLYLKPLSLPMHDNMRLEDLLSGLVVPATLVPSFSSYSLTRLYVLKLTVSISCIGRTDELLISKPSGYACVLLPGRYRSRVAEAEAAAETAGREEPTGLVLGEGATGSTRTREADEETLPAYEGRVPAYEEVQTRSRAVEGGCTD